MKFYTIFFEQKTWSNRFLDAKGESRSPIDYIAASNKRPFTKIMPGDEIFIVTVKDGKLHIGGYLTADTPPISRVEAIKILDRSDLIDKDKYVIGRKDKMDYFRPSSVLNVDNVKNLQLLTSSGLKNLSFKDGGGIEHMDIYSPTEITESSATILKQHLNVGGSSYISEEYSSDSLDDEKGQPYDVRVWREVLARQGQPDFRKKLLKIYDQSCCVSSCKVVELLEAAHIDPHSEGGDYSLHNGLLLRSDIHTLFDQYLLAFDQYNRIVVSKKLKKSEYGIFHMKRLISPTPGITVSKEALAIRYAEFLTKEQSR